MCVGSATCSVVRYAFRSVTATNRALLFLVLGMRCGLCVFHFHFCVHHCLASRILFFRIFCNGEAVRFGRDLYEEVDEGRKESRLTYIRWHPPIPSIARIQTRASPAPIEAHREPQRHSHIPGGRRERSRRCAVPCAGITMVDGCGCDPRLCECERAMCARSALNLLGALKQPRHRLQRSTLSPLHEKVRTYLLIFSPEYSTSTHISAPPSGP